MSIMMMKLAALSRNAYGFETGCENVVQELTGQFIPFREMFPGEMSLLVLERFLKDEEAFARELGMKARALCR